MNIFKTLLSSSLLMLAFVGCNDNNCEDPNSGSIEYTFSPYSHPLDTTYNYKLKSYELKSISFTDDVVGIDIDSNNTAYIAGRLNGVHILSNINTKDATPIVLEQTIEVGGLVHSVLKDPTRDLLYVAAQDLGVKVYSINPLDLNETAVLMDTKTFASEAMDIAFIAPNYIAVAGGKSGVLFYQVDNVSNTLSLVQTIATNGYTHTVDYDQNNSLVYATLETNGTIALDVSNMANISIAKTYNAAKNINASMLSGNNLITANRDNGVDIFDITTNSLLSSINTTDDSIDAYYYEDNISTKFAAIANNKYGISFIDLTNPSLPVIARNALTGGDVDKFASAVFIKNGFAYIADGPNGLRIMDIDKLNINQGILKDSIMQGVHYACGNGISGETDAQGRYKYNTSCQDINFSIGGVFLGSISRNNIKLDGITYPADILSLDRNNTTKQSVKNIIRLLQSLDTDGDPTNGIVISPTDALTLQGQNIDLSSDTVTASSVDALIALTGRTPISESYALAHYEETLHTEANVTTDTVAPRPAKVDNGTTSILTNKRNISFSLVGEVGTNVYIDGIDSGVVVNQARKADINVSISGNDGNYTFSITLVDALSQMSDALVLNVELDTTISQPTIDLDALSDSGDSSTDNITNITTPTIIGTADTNTSIILKEGNTTLATTQTASDGTYKVTLSALKDGEYDTELSVLATDLAGNSATNTLTLRIDTIGGGVIFDLNSTSDSGNSASDNITNDATPTISSNKETTIYIKDATGTTVQTLNTTSANNFSVTLSTLVDGVYTAGINALTGTDVAGNPINSTPITMLIDTRITVTLDLKATSDSGKSNTDNITNITTPTLIGTTDANATVTISDGTNILATTSADSTGAYSVTLPTLSSGEYNLSLIATASDIAGNSINSSTLTLSIDTVGGNTATIDLTTLSDTGTSSTDNITNDSTPTITTDIPTTLSIKNSSSVLIQTLNTTTANSLSVTLSSLSDGVYLVESGLNATDVAGNLLGYSAISITIDTQVATTLDLDTASDTGISSIDNITYDTTPTLKGVSEINATVSISDGTQVVVTKGVDAQGNYAFTLSTRGVGKHTFTTTTTDLAGNTKTTSLDVIIDTTTLTPTQDLATLSDSGSKTTDNITNNTTPTIIGTAEANASITVRHNGIALATTKADANGVYTVTLATLIDGIYPLNVSATDIAGNSANISGLNITIDTQTTGTLALSTVSDTGVSSTDKVTKLNTPTFIGTAEIGSTVTLKNSANVVVATGTTLADGTFTLTLQNTLADGINVLSALFTDIAGNTVTASINISIDTLLSQPTLDLKATSDSGKSNTDNITNITMPTLIGTTDANATVTISDGTNILATTSADSTGAYSVTLPTLSSGEYNLSLIATASDIAGNSINSSTLTLSIDTVGGNTATIDLTTLSDTGTSSTDNITNDSTPTITTDIPTTLSIKNSSSVLIQTLNTTTANSLSVTLSSLSDGVYLVESGSASGSTDLAGNILDNYASLQITIDTTVPVFVPSVASLEVNASISEKSLVVYTPNVSDATALYYELWGVDSASFNVDRLSGVISINDYAANVSTAFTLDLNVTDTIGNTSTLKLTCNIKRISPVETAKILASDAQVNDNFGSAVSISGDYIIVGAYAENIGAGAAYLYKRNIDNSITELTKITASDAQANDNFGKSVAIYGDYIIVGASAEDTGGNDAGAAYLYKRNIDNTVTELKKLTASDAKNYEKFGTVVSISGDYITIGAPSTYASTSPGAAYLYKRNTDTNITELSKITASDAQSGDYFGISVSIFGDYIAVGASAEDTKGGDAGAAYLYKRNTDSNITELVKITASDTQASDHFGFSTSISGDYIVVGAHGEDTGGSSAGAAYLYKRNTDNNITELAKITASDAQANDYFGTSVSIFEDYIVVGAYLEDANSGSNAGATYFYKRNTDNSVTELTKTTASDTQSYDHFGSSVSIFGNYIVVGASAGDTPETQDTGSCYLVDIVGDRAYMPTLTHQKFIRNESAMLSTWSLPKITIPSYLGTGTTLSLSGNDAGKFSLIGSTLQQVSVADYENPTDANLDNNYSLTINLTDTQGGVSSYATTISIQDTTHLQRAKILASNAQANDYFGSSVSISGDYIAVGAYGKDTAYLYKRNIDNSVTEIATFGASNLQFYEEFGRAIALSGDYIAVGSYGGNAFHLFKHNLNDSITELTKITASDTQANDDFGNSISISGDYIIVGAVRADIGASTDGGAAYLYKRNTDNNITELVKLTIPFPNTGDNFGNSVSISGNYIVIGSYHKGVNNTGAVYLYKRNTDNNITNLATITASDAQLSDNFGNSVSISGDYIVVGAAAEGTGGAAYFYKRNTDNSITELAKITASDAQANDYFGSSVSISGDYIVVGAYGEDTGAMATGASYIYKRNLDNSVTELTKITASDAQKDDYFGNSVSISGNNFVIGAKYEDTSGNSAGAVYLFSPDDNQP